MLPPFLPLFLLSLPLTLSQTTNYLLPSDAVSILSFKSKADLHNLLYYSLTERFDFCQWLGVKCSQGRVVRYVLHDIPLHGTFPPNTLTSLSHLRVLSLHNTSLSGPLPDLSPLTNLTTLSFAHNNFSGTFPLSLLSLHRLTLVDLSFNSFNGPIPAQLALLKRLSSLKLEYNYFNGTVPPLNQTFLVIFNVSGNNLSGAIPVTPTLSRFDTSSFSLNSPELCGEIINKACKSLRSPFFVPTAPLGQSAQVQGGGVVVLSPPSSKTVPRQLKRTNLIVGFTVGVSLLVFSILAFLFVMLKKQSQNSKKIEEPIKLGEAAESKAETASHSQQQVVNVGERKGKSGNLVHCGGESGMVYGLEELMRASAELLGRGSVGTTYKAVVDSKLIVTVKRIDGSKSAITSSEAFERHMDVVGQLKHPNLVPILAYFQARGERLVIFEYQPNGSLFNLIHGSRSSRAKPLHWTSCLKIAEDVAQGLAYIHQSSKLVHGNLKSSNVLLGRDFEARVTDYCLAVLADTSSSEDPDSAACKAPETRKSIRRVTTKSDVYTFGVLLLELLTGKHPSQHPYLMPADMLDWVRAMREDDGADYIQLGLLTEIASVCSLTSPEQRPAMWQVLKMIHEVKERIVVDEDAAAPEYSLTFVHNHTPSLH